MFAIIRAGGKQYKVQAGDRVAIEKIDAEIGSVVTLEQVLLLGEGSKTVIGTPFIAGARVMTEVLSHEKDEKVIVFKKKRRHNYRRKKGHRQWHTFLEVVEVLSAGETPKGKVAAPKKETAVKKAEPKAAAPKKEAPAKKAAAKSKKEA